MLPEVELLLCCARPQPATDSTARIRQLLQGNLDWSYLLATARWHSVTSLLYWQLKTLNPPNLPPEVFEQLAAEFAATLQKNLFLTAQLLKAIELFQAAKIPAIPFKGSVLATTIYQNLALRQFNDLDILIDRADFFRAKELLEKAGYRPRISLNRRQQELRLLSNYEQDFVCDELQVNIDLHWEIAPPFFSLALPVADLLDTATSVTFAGKTIPVLSPENIPIVLCINGTKEGWSSLQRICDISGAIARFPDLNWSSLLRKSQHANCLESVLLGLYLARAILQTPLPSSVDRELKRHPQISTYFPQINRQLFQTCSTQLKPDRLAYFSWQLQGGFLRKLNYLLKLTLPINERDLAWVELPKCLFPLYYPLRLLRLISKYGFQQRKQN